MIYEFQGQREPVGKWKREVSPVWSLGFCVRPKVRCFLLGCFSLWPMSLPAVQQEAVLLANPCACCHCCAEPDHVLIWWLPVWMCLVNVPVCLFESCRGVTVHVLPSLPRDEELRRWSYHWFIMPALSVWLMASYTRANPSPTARSLTAGNLETNPNLFRTTESFSENSLIESSLRLKFSCL